MYDAANVHVLGVVERMTKDVAHIHVHVHVAEFSRPCPSSRVHCIVKCTECFH